MFEKLPDGRNGSDRLWRKLWAALLIAGFVTSFTPSAHAFDPRLTSGLMGADLEYSGPPGNWPRTSLSRAYIPDSVDLSAKMPPPVAQLHGSCVAYSVAYAVRGYYAALENGLAPGADNNTPSPAFVHSRIRNKNASCTIGGSHALTALKFLASSGAPSRARIPDGEMCSNHIDGTGADWSGQFSIRDAEEIYDVGRNRRRVSNGGLDKIKLKLAAGHPVMVGFELVKSRLFPAQAGIMTLSLLQADGIYHGSLGENAGSGGGHAMTFVGYDERRQAFLVQNSWGKEWAGNGFGWISYAATKADMRYAYIMKVRVVPPIPRPELQPRTRDRIPEVGGCSAVYYKGMRSNTAGRLVKVYEGFVESRAELDALRRRHNGETEFDVNVRPWPICEALTTLEEPMAALSRPLIEMIAPRGTYRNGDLIGFRVTSPNFHSYLYVVYLQADGTVVNLVPRRGPLRREVLPGKRFTFGDGRNGRQTFEAQPPSGAEAIFAIASRSPIEELEKLEDGKGGQFRLAAAEAERDILDAQDRLYLSVLRAGLARMPDRRAARRHVTADVMFLKIGK